MNAQLWRNVWIDRGLRFILGGVFIYAGMLKFAEPQAFADSVATFRLLPAALINLLALGLPVFEVALGGLLLAGWWTRTAALGSLILTGIFLLALASALLRGLSIDCGCFGSKAASISQGWTALVRDVPLFIAALVCYARQIKTVTYHTV